MLAFALQIAKNDGHAILGGQTVQFPIEQGEPIETRLDRRRLGLARSRVVGRAELFSWL